MHAALVSTSHFAGSTGDIASGPGVLDFVGGAMELGVVLGELVSTEDDGVGVES